MRTTMRKATTGLAALATAATLMVSAAPAATAASGGPLRDHCIGTRVDHHVLKNDYGTRVGRVELWYSSVNGGQNCVMTYNYGAGKRFTSAFLQVDDNGDRRADRSSWDEGWYTSYAGGSYRNNTRGDCVKWGGGVYGTNTGSHRDDAFFRAKYWRHCG